MGSWRPSDSDNKTNIWPESCFTISATAKLRCRRTENFIIAFVPNLIKFVVCTDLLKRTSLTPPKATAFGYIALPSRPLQFVLPYFNINLAKKFLAVISSDMSNEIMLLSLCLKSKLKSITKFSNKMCTVRASESRCTHSVCGMWNK